MQEGDVLKPFTANDQDGHEFKVGDFIGKKPIVIYFYPKKEMILQIIMRLYKH